MPYVGRGLTTGAQYQKLDAIAINNATTFTMSVGSVNVSPDQNHLILVVNGVIQEPGTGFTVAGSTCTLASAITTSGHSGTDTIYGVIAGDAAFAAYDSIGANALGVTAGTVTASRAIVPDSNKDIASFRNVTLTGELDAATLDISGNADIDGTTNLDAVDIDGAVQVDNTITVGADDQGYDVKFFGDTASAYMLWDTSADDLVFAGAAGIDLAGDLDVDGTTNLDAVDIDGAVNMAADLTMGANILMADDTSIGISDSDERIEFDASGDISVLGANFGIGTTSPVQKLTIEGDTTNAGDGTEGQLVVRGSTDSNIKMMIGVDTTSKVGFISPMDHGTAWEDLALCSNGGNVGIGTATPQETLHVIGGGSAFNLEVETASSGYNGIKITNSEGSFAWYTDGDKFSAYDVTDSRDIMVFDGSGNVGIGETSPDRKLKITETSTTANMMKLSPPADTTADIVLIQPSSGDFADASDVLYILDSAKTILNVKGSGNVGIGTTSPGYKLDIKTGATTSSAVHIGETEYSEGGMFLTSVEAGNATWSAGADYVSGNWTARREGSGTCISSSITYHDGTIRFNTDTGLTKDATFTPSERMRIDSAGNVGIGCTPDSGMTFQVEQEKSNDQNMVFFKYRADDNAVDDDDTILLLSFGDDADASGGHFIEFQDANDTEMTGTIVADSGTATNNSVSDYRNKENISLITGGLERIKALKPSYFNYKTYPNKIHEGFIAHEVQEAGIGYAVRGEKDAMKIDGKRSRDTYGQEIQDTQLFAVTNIIPQMVNAIQELTAKVEALENA